jgi:hypothetical protein
MSKPCRPYTEYNLFFQLEREHILQVQLGFEPDYEPHDVFDPSDAANYQGPPLPSRYSELILLKDWHLPGKEKRRKRRHRKTHGMISFQELSLKIAEAWKTVDSETRQFCAELCDVGLTQYKHAMLAHKAVQNQDNEFNAATFDNKTFATKTNENLSLLGISSSKATFVPTDRCSLAEVDAAFENDLNLSMENLHDSMSDITASSDRSSVRSSLQESFVDSMVDIDDDTIIDMYKSAPVEAEQEEATKSATIVSGNSSSSNVVPSSFDPHGNNSFIDSTLNDIKNMRKAILNQQIQMQSSIMTARRLAKGIQKQGQNHMMNGFAARSA